MPGNVLILSAEAGLLSIKDIEADAATIRRIFARPSARQAARNQTSSKS
jgi:hypothetical protein